jgi:PAS domain S-box-containing protein
VAATTLIDQLAIYQSQITIVTGVLGVLGTLFSQKMRAVYIWPFRTFHKAFGNKAMEDKLDFLIQELTYDEESGITLKTAVKAISEQMESLSGVFEERSTTLKTLTGRLGELSNRVGDLQTSVENKNNAIIAKFTAMLDQPNTPPLFETDANGEYIWVSASYIALTGRSLSELLGWGWTNAVHKDDVLEVRQAWELCIDDGRIFEHAHRFTAVSGIVTKVHCRATPIINNQEITGWIGVVEILPRRKHNHSNAELLFIG